MTPANLPDALHRLAEDAFAAGRADASGELLRLAVRLRTIVGVEAERLHAEGLAKLEAGDLVGAEMLLAKGLEGQPANASWHEHLGIALARQKRYAEAAVTFRVSLRLDPKAARVWHLLAMSYADSGNSAAAELAIREARAIAPDRLDYGLFLVGTLRTAESLEAAEAVARELVERHPGDAGSHMARGIALAEQSKHDGAIASFRRAIELAPQSAEAHSNLAAALGKAKRWDECVQSAREAIALNPNHAGAWGNLGNAYRDLGRYDEAHDALERCLSLDPGDADAAGNLALTMASLGYHERALKWYDRSLELKPSNGEMQFNRSLTYLTLGDYERGWPAYEYRWRTEAMKGTEPKYPAPRWASEAGAGRTIFLSVEQGLGDTIQFLRFAKDVAERGFRVLVQPPLELAELTRTVPGVDGVIDRPVAEAAFHCHCPLLSVPGLLKIDPMRRSGEPYMTVPADAIARWTDRLAELRGFRVGLVWQGNPKHGGDRWRSIPLAKFAGLAAIPGVATVSLQKGTGWEQLEDFDHPILDLGGELGSFSDTAAVLKNLDLLVTVDSAVAHLAGAIGVPVWTLVSFNGDWRWLKGRSDTPWYSSMRLVRQPKLQDWDGAIAVVERELRSTASMKPKSSRS